MAQEKPQDYKSIEVYWTKKAKEFLLGRKIVSLGYVSSDLADECYWDSRGLVLKLDDGTEVFVMSDDEGNNCGSLHIYTDKKSGINTSEILPTI